MTDRWNPTETGFSFAHATCEGRVETATAGRPHAIHFHTTAETPDLAAWVEFQSITYSNSQGRSRRLNFRPGRPILQDATLSLVDLVDSAEGVQAAAGYRLHSDSLNLEMELTTIGTVDDLTLHVDCHATGGEWQLFQPDPLVASQIVAKVVGKKTGLLLMADLGDFGATESPAPGHLQLSFLRSPLEKGVVMVARLCLRSFDPKCSQGDIDAAFNDWLSERAFL